MGIALWVITGFFVAFIFAVRRDFQKAEMYYEFLKTNPSKDNLEDNSKATDIFKGISNFRMEQLKEFIEFDETDMIGNLEKIYNLHKKETQKTLYVIIVMHVILATALYFIAKKVFTLYDIRVIISIISILVTWFFAVKGLMLPRIHQSE